METPHCQSKAALDLEQMASMLTTQEGSMASLGHPSRRSSLQITS